MYYFNHNRQEKKLPEKGDIIYIIPIRYWEPDDYSPRKFTVEKAYIQKKDYKLVLYGQFEDEKPNTPMYAAINLDAEWYWNYDKAREVQLLFAQIDEIISKDVTEVLVNKILKNKKLE